MRRRAHARHFTMVVMPLLFLVFGALPDVVLFIASWIASTAPPEAAAAPAAPTPP